MLAGDLILRWVHIMGAIMLVGGTVLMCTVYVYAKERSAEKPGAEFVEQMRKLWARLVMIASGWLIVSGIISFMLLIKRYEIEETEFPGSMYHMIFGIKFLLALVVFFLAALISGRSGLAEKMRAREKMWLTLNMVLTGLVVFLAVILHAAKRSEKSESSALPASHGIEIVCDSAFAQLHREIG